MSSYAPKDTQARGGVAVAVSLVAASNGRSRLVFDDVSRQAVMDAIALNHEALFAVAEFSTEELEGLALSKDDFAQIGENVVARLTALTRRGRDGA